MVPVMLAILVAQLPCVIERPAPGDTRVTCDGVSRGLRHNADGSKDRLEKVRGGPWKASRITTRFPRELDPIADRTPPPQSPPPPVPTGPAVHDLLVLATPRAIQAAGGLTGMFTEITLAVALTAEVLANSAVPITPRLVGVERVEYVESGITTDLSRLRGTTDGYMDGVHALRQQYGADDVLLIGEGYGEACGVAYLYQAFAVVRRDCASGNLSLTHEYGHTINLKHDPMTNCGQPVCDASYNNGHRSMDNAVGDTMSYGGGRKRQLSNPDVPFIGRTEPSGIANARDNARMARETAASVAARMPTTVSAPALPPPAPQTGGEWSTPTTVFASGGLFGFADDGENAVYALSGRKFRRSLDEGVTWDAELSLPGVRVDPYLERPLAGYGSVVAVVALDIQNWSDDWLGTRPNGALVLYVSTNKGASFTGPLRATPTTERALRWSVAVDAAGRVHWVWMHDNGPSWEVKYARYENGVVTVPVVIAEGVGPVGAERPSLAINGDTVIAAWLDGRYNIGTTCAYEGNKPIPDCPEIVVRRSLNGGATWNDPVRLTFDATTYSGRPTLVNDGPKFRLLYDKRPLGGQNALWQFASDDNGTTWAESLIVDQAGDENHASAALRGTDGIAAWVLGSGNRGAQSFDTGLTWTTPEGYSSVATPMVAMTTNYLHLFTMNSVGALQVRRKARSGGSPPPPPPPPPDPCVADPLVPPPASAFGWPADPAVTGVVITQVGRTCPAIEVPR